MASFFYTRSVASLLQGNIALATATMKATLVDSADYVANKDTHDFYDDITAAGRVATGTLVNVTVVAGVATVTIDANDLTLSSVSGDQSEAVVIWEDTAGAESADPVVLYLELVAPITPNGGDIVLQWHVNGLATVST
jgi:hypothetical protein